MKRGLHHPSRNGATPPFEARLREWQLHRLRHYLQRQVAPFSAHYHELFRKSGFRPEQLRTADDLRRIPFTTKADFSARPDAVKRFILTPERSQLIRRPSVIARTLFSGRAAVARRLEREYRPLLMTSTTGRSAEPVPFFYTAHDLALLQQAGSEVMEVCEARREERMINLFPFAPHLAFWITHYAGTDYGVLVVSSGGGKTMGTEGNLRLISKLQPNVLIGMPTFLYHLFSTAIAEGVELPNLNKIVLGGEKAPEGMRRRLRAMAMELGAGVVDILSTYGFTEAKMAWAECPFPEDHPSAGYHLNPALGLFEIVDPESGEPVGEGEPGEIVFTPLAARGSVVIRYRTGDLISGGLVHESCPWCGRQVPRLVGSISRRSEVREMHLDKLKGTLVDFNALEHLLDDCAAVGTWQLELRKRHDDPLETDEIILHAERPEGGGEEEVRRELDRLFSARTEIHLNAIHFHSAAEMRDLQGVGRELKESRLVDHRPKTRKSVATTGGKAS